MSDVSDSDDDLNPHILVRPYDDDVTAGSAAPAPVSRLAGGGSSSSSKQPSAPSTDTRKAKVFTPKPPSERKAVEKSLLSATSYTESAQSVLQGALRRQETDGLPGGTFAANLQQERFRGMSLHKFGISDSGRVVGTSPLTSGGGNAPVPRKAKEWKEGKSMELMDLAFTPIRKCADGVVRKNYTPISLPYFNVEEEEENVGGEGGAGGPKKGRPTMRNIDEGNSNAAKELFLTTEGELKEDSLFLLQLPSMLPELADPSEEVQREHEDAASAGAGATITRLPDGMIGKLKIHKSGKVRMEIGGVPFCVDQGSSTFFHQELCCVSPLAKEAVNLGPISNRVVVTPDIDGMFLEAERAEEAAKK